MNLKLLIYFTIATYELVIFQDSNYAKITNRTDIKVITIESKKDTKYTDKKELILNEFVEPEKELEKEDED